MAGAPNIMTGDEIVSLQGILPQPRRIVLAGVPYLVAPLRLRDLAALESWAASREPSILADSLPLIEAANEGPERDKLIRECWLALEAATGRASYGGRGFLGRLCSPVGTQILLAAVLKPHQAEITLDEIEAIAGSGDGGGFDELVRFAFGFDPLDDLARLIDPPVPPSGGDAPTWVELYCDLAERFPWMTIEAFGELTVNQFFGLRSGGKVVPGQCRHPKGSTGFFASARRRAELFGSPAPPAPAPKPKVAVKPVKPKTNRQPLKNSPFGPKPEVPAKPVTPRKPRQPRKDA